MWRTGFPNIYQQVDINTMLWGPLQVKRGSNTAASPELWFKEVGSVYEVQQRSV